MARVVITGVGVVGAFGFDVAAFWAALHSPPAPFGGYRPEKAGLPPLPRLVAVPVDRARLMAELPDKGVRALNFDAAMLLVAASRALVMARVAPAARGAFGVSVGTRWAGMDDYAEFWLERLTWGPRRVSPSRGPNTGANAAACHASIKLGLRGPNLTVSNRRTSAGEALLSAAALVMGGQAPGMLAGGVEALSYLRGAQALAEREAGMEPGSAAPALALGEGAALLVLEDEQAARARGGEALAVLDGQGRAFQPGKLGEALNQAVRDAVAASSPEQALQVDAVFGPTGAGLASAAVQGLRAAAGNQVEPRMHAMEETFGDWEGGATALQAAAAVLAIKQRRWPGGANAPAAYMGLGPAAAALVYSVDPAGHALALVIRAGAAHG